MGKGLKRLLAVALIVAFAAGVWTLAAVSFSDVSSDFQTGETVSASEFNDLFGAINDNFAQAQDAINDRWSLTGNAGTDPQTNYLGTADDIALEFRVNAERALRVEPGSSPNLIGGYAGNLVGDDVVGATIGGGGAEGDINEVTGDYGTIGGGERNQATDEHATVGGGHDNVAGERFATVGGGDFNRATGVRSTVAGGRNNRATGTDSTVGGGRNNVASGTNSTVAGGFSNEAAGHTSFAAGLFAKIDEDHEGVFLWSDRTLGLEFHSEAANEFAARATGGVRFATAVDSFGEPTAGVTVGPGESSWSSLSDRDAKAGIASVDPVEIAHTLATIDVATWRWQAEDEGVRHMGPMAQDFYAAFGLGSDERRITTIDGIGVSLAAIQGLYQLVKDKDETIAAQAARIESLEGKVAELQMQGDRVEALEQQVEVLMHRLEALERSDERVASQ